MNTGDQIAGMRLGCEAAMATGDIAAMRAMLAPDVQWYDEEGRLRADGDGADMAAATMTFGPGSPIERKAYLLTLCDGKIVRVQDQRG
jgi:hypothetical protein